jgi:hypothetical protein
MNRILTDDAFYGHIMNRLSTKDLINLDIAMLQKVTSNYEKKQPLIKKIISRLKKIFGPDYDGFIRALQLSGAAISGSFIIQCILDVEWSGSDIDIYVKYGGDVSGIDQAMELKMKKYNDNLIDPHILKKSSEIFPTVDNQIDGLTREETNETHEVIDDIARIKRPSYTDISGPLDMLKGGTYKVKACYMNKGCGGNQRITKCTTHNNYHRLVDWMTYKEGDVYMDERVHSYVEDYCRSILHDEILHTHNVDDINNIDKYYNNHKNMFGHVMGSSQSTNHVPIKWVSTYKYNGTKLQIIQLDGRVNDIYDHMIEYFDLDICKSLFEIDEYGVAQLFVPHLDKIINKQCDFKFSFAFKNIVERYHKYVARGFTINYNKEELYNTICRLGDDVSQEQRRICKIIEMQFIKHAKKNDYKCSYWCDDYNQTPGQTYEYLNKIGIIDTEYENCDNCDNGAHKAHCPSKYNMIFRCLQMERLFDGKHLSVDCNNDAMGKGCPVKTCDESEQVVTMDNSNLHNCDENKCIMDLCDVAHLHYEWGNGQIIVVLK